MRPHRLEVTAFGAFAGTVEVDFDHLATGGLFLLHGETGAGKSTLLDAIGFALYGRVPGDRGAARRLRSDHAAPGDRTQVRLEATLGGRRLRITRAPEQARPKKRGTGLTTEPAKVLVEEHAAGGWTAVSTRVGEADQEIAERLGMSADQFWQVILLPQGEFAAFLRAASEDRARLLKKVFGTERYRAVEDWLADRRRSVTQALDAHREEIRVRAARVAQIAEVEPPVDVPEPLWGTDLACQHEAAVEVAARVAATAAATLATAAARAEATRSLAARQERRTAAERAAADLATVEPAMQDLTGEVERAVAAAGVTPVLDALARAEAVAAAAGADHDAARARAAAAGAAEGSGPEELRAGAAEFEHRRGRLADLASLAEAIEAEQAAAASAHAVAADLGAQLTTAEAERPALTARRDDLVAARAAARAAATALPGAARRADLLAAAAAAAAELGPAETAAAQLRTRHLDARDVAAALRDAHHDIRRDRFDGMVAELAARLTDGDPCPVCGSPEHPDPSLLRIGRVTHEEEERAAAAAEEARLAAEQRGQELATATGRLQELRERLAGLRAGLAAAGDAPDADGPAAEELAAAAAHAAAHHDALAAEAGRVEALDAELGAAEQAIGELDRLCTAAAEQRTAAVRDAAAADARAAGHRTTLADRLAGEPDLATALANAAEAAAAFTAAATARETRDRATATQAEAAAAAAAAARTAGFDDPAEAAAAARTAGWRAGATERLRAHRGAVDGVAARLTDPDLDVQSSPPADVAAAEAAVAAAAGEHERAVSAVANARERHAQLGRRVPELTRALAELPALTDRTTEVRQVAELVAGQGGNERRMTLSAFVLAARLEEVAAVAGQHLLRMTSGRFSLVHTDSARGNRKAGLGLLARDTWTGVDRDTATLSGGETFLASLALALALADVVSAESGGTRLEALFVDEGFGSLDADTLDEVMDVLDGLREGGRVVGLVSHVTELRQRIPTQVHVRKRENGSDLEVVA